MIEPETPMERAAQYKRARIARNLTQTQLAKAVGVRQATISDRETGAHEFGQEAIMALRSLPLPSRRFRCLECGDKCRASIGERGTRQYCRPCELRNEKTN
jgi:DNA-binding XRE family transcriptional regulator